MPVSRSFLYPLHFYKSKFILAEGSSAFVSHQNCCKFFLKYILNTRNVFLVYKGYQNIIHVVCTSIKLLLL